MCTKFYYRVSTLIDRNLGYGTIVFRMSPNRDGRYDIIMVEQDVELSRSRIRRSLLRYEIYEVSVYDLNP